MARYTLTIELEWDDSREGQFQYPYKVKLWNKMFRKGGIHFIEDICKRAEVISSKVEKVGVNSDGIVDLGEPNAKV